VTILRFVRVILCVLYVRCRFVLIVESAYRSVADVYSCVRSWFADRYLSWKRRSKRSNSTTDLPQLSENITLPSTGQSACSQCNITVQLRL